MDDGPPPDPAVPAEPKPRRRRRPTDEVRSLILAAARRTFAESGYARTTTRMIAETAQVSEVLLFRHFQSKAELFHDAVATPFESLLRDYGERHARDSPSPDAGIPPYVSDLFELLSNERGLTLALIADRTFGRSGGSLPGLDTYLAEATEALRRYHRKADHRPELPPEFGARFAFASVIAAALFQEWMFAGLGDRDAIQAALGDFVLFGLFGRR